MKSLRKNHERCICQADREIAVLAGDRGGSMQFTPRQRLNLERPFGKIVEKRQLDLHIRETMDGGQA